LFQLLNYKYYFALFWDATFKTTQVHSVYSFVDVNIIKSLVVQAHMKRSLGGGGQQQHIRGLLSVYWSTWFAFLFLGKNIENQINMEMSYYRQNIRKKNNAASWDYKAPLVCLFASRPSGPSDTKTLRFSKEAAIGRRYPIDFYFTRSPKDDRDLYRRTEPGWVYAPPLSHIRMDLSLWGGDSWHLTSPSTWMKHADAAVCHRRSIL